MKHHNEVYKDLKGTQREATETNEERHTRMLDNVERLGKAVRMKAPQTVLRHYASLIRHDAEALGIMIHITA
jgi:hypothetical protein